MPLKPVFSGLKQSILAQSERATLLALPPRCVTADPAESESAELDSHVNICGLTRVIRYLKRERSLYKQPHREKKATSDELSAGTTNASPHPLRQHPLTFTHTNHEVTTQHVCLIFNEMTQNYSMPQLGEDSKPTGPEMEYSPVMRGDIPKKKNTPRQAAPDAKLGTEHLETGPKAPRLLLFFHALFGRKRGRTLTSYRNFWVNRCESAGHLHQPDATVRSQWRGCRRRRAARGCCSRINTARPSFLQTLLWPQALK